MSCGVVELGLNVGARELGGDVRVEGFDHHQAHAHGIHAGPGLRAVVEQPEFGGSVLDCSHCAM
jgi:hypothetical protein